MRRGFFSATVAIGTLVIICLVTGCTETAAERARREADAARMAEQVAEQTVESRERKSQNAVTFTHDNHWWVRLWHRGIHCDYFVHHPDCPCQKRTPEIE